MLENVKEKLPIGGYDFLNSNWRKQICPYFMNEMQLHGKG